MTLLVKKRPTEQTHHETLMKLEGSLEVADAKSK